jgi:hypothetical protein
MPRGGPATEREKRTEDLVSFEGDLTRQLEQAARRLVCAQESPPLSSDRSIDRSIDRIITSPRTVGLLWGTGGHVMADRKRHDAFWKEARRRSTSTRPDPIRRDGPDRAPTATAHDTTGDIF